MVDIYSPTAQDRISPTELSLYHMIMEYRTGLGLPAIPMSTALSATAGRHAIDTVENIWEAGLTLPAGTNLHSWSDAPYYADHSQPEVMWNAPARLGLTYPSEGFEISAAGYLDIGAALVGWQGSPGHNAVIANTGIWASQTWQAIGLGVEQRQDFSITYQGNAYHVWFGASADPGGPPLVEGTAAAELLTGTLFDDLVAGGAGNDTVYGRDGADTLRGGAGADLLGGGDGDDSFEGGAGADVIWTARGHDRATGGEGDDTIGGAAGNDALSGGDGGDALWGSLGNDTLRGDGGNDTLGGADGNDDLDGGAGNDELWGAAGSDTLRGGTGDDAAGAGPGDDDVAGGAGNDSVYGGLGNDTLRGGTGDDLVFGAAGDDRLSGDAGNDTLYAGPGNDTVSYGAGDGADVLEYFSAGADRLELDATLWGGGLSAAQVVAQFGSDAGADYRLDFGGGNTITLAGQAGLSGLEAAIDIV